MPQTKTDYWYGKSSVSKQEDYDRLVNLISNLIFADKGTNSSIKNKDFDTKKKALEEIGKIDLTKDVSTKTEWGKKEIEERTKAVIEKFIKTFPYFINDKNL